MYVYVYRSDQNASNSGVYVYDGTTVVASNLSIGFQFDGSNVVVTVTINSDGSGSVKLEQGANSVTLSWSARTWTNGTGQYHGFYFDHSGSDGTGGVTRSQVDDISIDTTDGGGGGTYLPKIIQS